MGVERRRHPRQRVSEQLCRLPWIGELSVGDPSGHPLRDRGQVPEQGQLDHLRRPGDPVEEAGQRVDRGAVAWVLQEPLLLLPGLAVALGQLAEEQEPDLEQLAVAEIGRRFHACTVSHGPDQGNGIECGACSRNRVILLVSERSFESSK